MTPITHPLADIFLLGFIAACSLSAALFFLRFWRDTRDSLFLAFTVFFILQGFSYIFILRLSHPNEGSLWLFLLRLISVLSVLGAILWKNSQKG
jgi:uncharacterized membrane protein HdeD (DUF308 family)